MVEVNLQGKALKTYLIISSRQKESVVSFYVFCSLHGFASNGFWCHPTSPIFLTSLMMITDLSSQKKRLKKSKRNTEKAKKGKRDV